MMPSLLPAGLIPISPAISTAMSLNHLSKLLLDEFLEAGIFAGYKYSCEKLPIVLIYIYQSQDLMVKDAPIKDFK